MVLEVGPVPKSQLRPKARNDERAKKYPCHKCHRMFAHYELTSCDTGISQCFWCYSQNATGALIHCAVGGLDLNTCDPSTLRTIVDKYEGEDVVLLQAKDSLAEITRGKRSNQRSSWHATCMKHAIDQVQNEQKARRDRGEVPFPHKDKYSAVVLLSKQYRAELLGPSGMPAYWDKAISPPPGLEVHAMPRLPPYASSSWDIPAQEPAPDMSSEQTTRRWTHFSGVQKRNKMPEGYMLSVPESDLERLIEAVVVQVSNLKESLQRSVEDVDDSLEGRLMQVELQLRELRELLPKRS